eukprot:TRINITY_DN1238_c0_g1_i5.p2 TRINITY_DN1238_c0_g1~~TRINITY_DN1238_c0_g1_i5.p2  ORF type:complete len:389 (-),score=59.56 TRINITY_DN1238_c0_g1_i5:2550-3716(-)
MIFGLTLHHRVGGNRVVLYDPPVRLSEIPVGSGTAFSGVVPPHDMRPSFVVIIWESNTLPTGAAEGIEALQERAQVQHHFPTNAAEDPTQTSPNAMLGAPPQEPVAAHLESSSGASESHLPSADIDANSMDVLEVDRLDANNIRAGQLVAQSIMAYSDACLKEDIRSLEPDVQDRLSRIGVYVYKYKAELSSTANDEQRRKHIGILAQEVHREFPHAVLRQPDGYLAVDFSQLVSVLIQGQQELAQGQQELAQRQQELATRVAQLEMAKHVDEQEEAQQEAVPAKAIQVQLGQICVLLCELPCMQHAECMTFSKQLCEHKLCAVTIMERADVWSVVAWRASSSTNLRIAVQRQKEALTVVLHCDPRDFTCLTEELEMYEKKSLEWTST